LPIVDFQLPIENSAIGNWQSKMFWLWRKDSNLRWPH
jgi:hypothetical protein